MAYQKRTGCPCHFLPGSQSTDNSVMRPTNMCWRMVVDNREHESFSPCHGLVMSGVTDLDLLLASMSPAVVPGRFAMVAVGDPGGAGALDPICIFREEEATTVICPWERAEKAGIKAEGAYCQITLQVHSSLQAVGFLAAVASALAAAGIPCNAVSAFYHDHIFVPEEKASRAMEVLSCLARTREGTPQATLRTSGGIAPATAAADIGGH